MQTTISKEGLSNLYSDLLSGVSFSWSKIIAICSAKSTILCVDLCVRARVRACVCVGGTGTSVALA